MVRTTPSARIGAPSGPANQQPVYATKAMAFAIRRTIRSVSATERIVRLIANAIALVAFAFAGHHIEACLLVFRVEKLGKGAPSGERLRAACFQHLGGIVTPQQQVA